TKLILQAPQLILHSCCHLLPELSLLRHAALRSMVSAFSPLLNLTSFGANLVLVSLNLRDAFTVGSVGWKRNTSGAQKIFAKLDRRFTQLSLTFLTELLQTTPRCFP